MSRLPLALAVASALALTAATAIPASAAVPAHRGFGGHHGPEYYLSLGDSLSVGDQPNAQGVTLPTDQGYADRLYAMLRRDDRDLRLVKLGCPGETTTTLNAGGICGYAGDQRYSLTAGTGTQLAAAVEFLREHRGQVPLITIGIGPARGPERACQRGGVLGDRLDLPGRIAGGRIPLLAASAHDSSSLATSSQRSSRPDFSVWRARSRPPSSVSFS
jgi:hypothetical protein